MEQQTTPPTGIHAAVMAAQRMCAEKGISKDSKANMGGGVVAFRGVEAAMNTMAEILVVCGISLEPETVKLDIQHIARAEAGKFTRFATVECVFTFRAEDGSSQTARTWGEAMDFGDKATTKAQSVALRIALFNKFLIPTAATAFDPEHTEGNDDTSPIDGHPTDVRERQDGVTPPPPPASRESGELPPYPKDKFEKNFPEWKSLIESGAKTNAQILAMLSTKGSVNPVQKAKIEAIRRAS